MAILLAALLPGAACGQDATSFEDSMVWVVEPGSGPEDALAYGVVIRDGFQVLTVLDYEDYTASGSVAGQPVYDLEVISPKYGRFSAAVAAIDPRTSATLLYLKSETPGEYVHLPTAELADPSSLSEGQAVLIQGWAGADDAFSAASATAAPGSDPGLVFHVSEAVPQPDGRPFVGGQGAVITTPHNAVLGLIGNWGTDKLAVRLGYPGMLPPAVSIGEARKLAGNVIEAWSGGPALIVVITADRVSDYLPGGALKLSMAEPLSRAISNIVLAAGGPLAIEGFALERMVPLRGLEDYGGGTLVVAVFPRTVAIKNMTGLGGETLATAKWVGIQYGMKDQPNRLLYGGETYAVDGAFELTDVSELEQAIADYYE